MSSSTTDGGAYLGTTHRAATSASTPAPGTDCRMETVYVCPLASDDPQPAGPGSERARSATGRA